MNSKELYPLNGRFCWKICSYLQQFVYNVVQSIVIDKVQTPIHIQDTLCINSFIKILQFSIIQTYSHVNTKRKKNERSRRRKWKTK